MALISITQAAARYALSAKHFRYLAASGMIKAQKLGSFWAVDERSIETYLASERKRGPKPKKKSPRGA